MRRRIRNVFWGCIGAAFFALWICFITNLLDPGYAYSKNKEFMEDSHRMDVLFFGNSHMGNAVYPMELWRNQGIVSYNLAGFGHRIASTYWVMKNALDEAQPKLVVIDCHSLYFDEKMGSKEMLHSHTDAMPLNTNKLRMIGDLVDDPKDRLEFIWDFAVYHDRWWDLDREDFEKQINIQKGAEIAIDVVPPKEMAQRPMEISTVETVSITYLRRMIEECESRDIQVLLTYLPFPASEEEWQEALCAERIAAEYGIDCINFLELPVVDLAVDCSDRNSHLNGSGARKVTAYLGQYIVEHYDIPDHRGEEAFLDWEEDYKRYTNYKLEVMGELESLDKYWMMCADPAFDCCIYVDGGADIWRLSEMYPLLVDNISGGRAEKLAEAAASRYDYFLLIDRQENLCLEAVGEESLTADCSFGKIRYEMDEAGERILHLEGSEENYLKESSQGNKAAVQVIVMHTQDGSIANVKRFDSRLAVFQPESGVESDRNDGG